MTAFLLGNWKHLLPIIVGVLLFTVFNHYVSTLQEKAVAISRREDQVVTFEKVKKDVRIVQEEFARPAGDGTTIRDHIDRLLRTRDTTNKTTTAETTRPDTHSINSNPTLTNRQGGVDTGVGFQDELSDSDFNKLAIESGLLQ